MTHTKPINPGKPVTDSDVRRIYDGIRALTLPKAEWTHGAHLCAGTAIIHDMGLRRAEAEMPDIIQAYNKACGVPNTETEGYHHTITLFYLREIDRALSGQWDKSMGRLATDILQSGMAGKTYPLRFYSKDRLFSAEARRAWIEPDILNI